MKKVFIDFLLIFIVSFSVSVIVSFLYTLIVHRTGTVNWDISFVFAIIFGIVLTWKDFKKK